MAIASSEGSFPFSTFFNLHLRIDIGQVKLGEMPISTQLIQWFPDQR